MSPLKIEFNTVRELEKKSSRVFMWAGGAFVTGMVLVFIFPPLGGVIMAAGALLALFGIAWVSMLGKEASRAIYCPYCSSKNDVYMSRQKFDCDICKRPIILSESGEPIRAMDANNGLHY